MAQREDLLVEESAPSTAPATGTGTGSTAIGGIPGSVSSGGVGEYPLTARYFRVAAYGVASAAFVITARKLPID